MTPSVIGWILVVPRAGGCVLELSVSLRWAAASTAGHLATHGSVLVLEQEDLLAYQTAGGWAALSLKWCGNLPMWAFTAAGDRLRRVHAFPECYVRRSDRGFFTGTFRIIGRESVGYGRPRPKQQ